MEIVIIGIATIFVCGALGCYHEREYNEKKAVCHSLFNIFPEESFKR